MRGSEREKTRRERERVKVREREREREKVRGLERGNNGAMVKDKDTVRQRKEKRNQKDRQI